MLSNLLYVDGEKLINEKAKDAISRNYFGHKTNKMFMACR